MFVDLLPQFCEVTRLLVGGADLADVLQRLLHPIRHADGGFFRPLGAASREPAAAEQQAKRRRQRQQRERQLHAEGVSRSTFQVPELEEPISDDLLLRYANHRILTYLRSSYANACFEWCEPKPTELIRTNGTGRIRLYNVDDFDHADITFGKDAAIRCDLLRIVPLSKTETGADDPNNIPPNKQPIDPRIWYENSGRTVLEALVADLNSRGHSKLTLRENGDICIQQGEELVSQEHLSNFPAKVYWPRLVEVLESNGLAAETTTQGIQVSW